MESEELCTIMDKRPYFQWNILDPFLALLPVTFRRLLFCLLKCQGGLAVVSSSILVCMCTASTTTSATEDLDLSTQVHPWLSQYKMSIVRARCQARCNAQYGMQKLATPHEPSDLYRPFMCARARNTCLQCSAPCKRDLKNTSTCADFCTDVVCENSCQFFNQVYSNEAGTAGPLLAEGLAKKIVSLSQPTPACVYTPTAQDAVSEGSTIVLRWNIRGPNGHSTSHPLSFVIEVKDNQSMDTWELLGNTNFSIIPISNLDCNSVYMFRVSPVSQEGLVLEPVTSDWLSLPKAGKPLAPENVTVVQQYVRGHSIRAEIKWTVPNNAGCYFMLYWMTFKEKSFHSEELKEWVGYKYELNNLAFDSDYEVEIETYDRYFRTSSQKARLKFRTLSCLKSTSFNYFLCAPDPPVNFTFSAGSPYPVNESLYVNISLTWKPPAHVNWYNRFDRYILRWEKHLDHRYATMSKPDRGVVALDVNITQWTLSDIHCDSKYLVTIEAESKGGSGQKSSLDIVTVNGDTQVTTPRTENNVVDEAPVGTLQGVYYASIIPAILTGFLILVCLLYYKKIKKNRRFFTGTVAFRKEEINPLYEYRIGNLRSESNPLLVNDEYEVDYSCLKFISPLGEGTFGKVLKAEFTQLKSYPSLTATPRIVAVKKLKEHATPEERRFLLLEIDAMKTLGHHPHLIGIIACVTNFKQPCLIMDYCPLGDLRTYLRQHRIQTSYISESALRMNSGASNSSSDTVPEMLGKLSQTTLLSYARQIASGMEHLMEHRYIHRDLAARNILVASHQTVKISDFGLSRDVYETNIYQPTSSRKLPYKWMAIESILDHIFTIKSDVWSYGILLWEIVTLGGCPYPGIANTDLFQLLNEGYRLERPSNCSADVYKIMLSCWHPCQDDRPCFKQLKHSMETLLEATCSYIDVFMEVSPNYYTNDSGEKGFECSSCPENMTNCKQTQDSSVALPVSDQDDSPPSYCSQTARYPSTRYSHLYIAPLPVKRNLAQLCPHYPLSKCPYVVETNLPVPGLSEELLQRTIDSTERTLKDAELAVKDVLTNANEDASSVTEARSGACSNNMYLLNLNWPKSPSSSSAAAAKADALSPIHSTNRFNVKHGAFCRTGDKFGLDCVYPQKGTLKGLVKSKHKLNTSALKPELDEDMPGQYLVPIEARSPSNVSELKHDSQQNLRETIPDLQLSEEGVAILPLS